MIERLSETPVVKGLAKLLAPHALRGKNIGKSINQTLLIWYCMECFFALLEAIYKGLFELRTKWYCSWKNAWRFCWRNGQKTGKTFGFSKGKTESFGRNEEKILTENSSFTQLIAWFNGLMTLDSFGCPSSVAFGIIVMRRTTIPCFSEATGNYLFKKRY